MIEEYSISSQIIRSKTRYLASQREEDGFRMSLMIRKMYSLAFPPKSNRGNADEGDLLQIREESGTYTNLISNATSTNVSPVKQRTMFLNQPYMQLESAQQNRTNETNNQTSVVVQRELITFEDNTNIVQRENAKFKEFVRDQLLENKMMEEMEKKEGVRREKEFVCSLTENALYQEVVQCVQQIQEGQLDLGQERFVDISRQCRQAIKERLKTKDQNLQQYMLVDIIASTYNAQVLRCRGQHLEAIRELEKVLRTYAIREPSTRIQILKEIALNHFQLLRLNRALDYFVKALNVAEANDWKYEAATILQYLAQIYAFYNRITDAKRIGYYVLETFQKAQVLNEHKIADTYHTLGVVFFHSKEYDFALQFLDMSLELKTKLFGENDFSLLSTLNMLGITSYLQSEFDKAHEYLQRAVCIYGEDLQICQGQLLNNMGISSLSQGEKAMSKACLSKALHIYQQFFDQNHALYRRARRNQMAVEEAEVGL